MKITYISHATLSIEVNGIKLVTDPWVKGTAYCGQWHLFPKPLSPDAICDANVVIYSHGHEDHLHAESLKTIQKNASVFYPYSWYGGTLDFFNELGFTKVHEVLNEHPVQINEHIRVTYLSNNLDNVIVMEIGDQVLVNINDALPSASEGMIEHFIKKINKKWPKIDYVFSSYGGASYFPNTVHYVNKNDIEIGETRELFFVNNFCKIISGLQPKFAVPFASDFVLLDDRQRWINNCKFPREKLKAFYQTYTKGFSKTELIEAYPDDYFETGKFFKRSDYHKKIAKGRLLDSIDVDYKQEISEKKKIEYIDQSEYKRFLEAVKQHILNKQYIIPEEIRRKIKFAIKITDVKRNNVLQVNFREGITEFKIFEEPDLDLDLLMEVKSKTLLYSFNNEWGGDAIIIGYGAEITIYNEDAILHEYENFCVRLLSRYPNTKEYLKKNPLRALRYLISDDIKRKNLLNKLLNKRERIIDFTEPKLGNRNLWLNKSKCDVCKACNI